MLRLGRKQCSECCALEKYRGNEDEIVESSCRHGMHVWSCDLACVHEWMGVGMNVCMNV